MTSWWTVTNKNVREDNNPSMELELELVSVSPLPSFQPNPYTICMTLLERADTNDVGKIGILCGSENGFWCHSLQRGCLSSTELQTPICVYTDYLSSNTKARNGKRMKVQKRRQEAHRLSLTESAFLACEKYLNFHLYCLPVAKGY